MHTNNFTYPPAYDSMPAHRPAPAPTNEELQRQMTRIETRLVKLMHHMGIDTHGNPLLDAYGDPL